MALELISDYLAGQGVTPAVVYELRRFCGALEELDRGTVHRSLAPIPAHNRPIESGDVWEVRAHLAMVADLLIECGQTKAAAAKVIWRELGDVASTVAPDPEAFSRRLAEWHRIFLKEECKDEAAQALFSQRQKYVAHYSRHTGDNAPNDLARHILNHTKLIAIMAADPTVMATFVQSKKRGQGDK